jgi:hypothetical protein
MPGITVFASLVEALKAGYSVHERTEHGYIVRTRTPSGWALAIVTVRA